MVDPFKEDVIPPPRRAEETAAAGACEIPELVDDRDVTLSTELNGRRASGPGVAADAVPARETVELPAPPPAPVVGLVELMVAEAETLRLRTGSSIAGRFVDKDVDAIDGIAVFLDICGETESLDQLPPPIPSFLALTDDATEV